MTFTDGTTGCSSSTASGTITVNPTPTVTIPAGDEEICEGETVTLSPTTGGTWSSSDATVATIDNAGVVTGVSAGTAEMTFTDGTTGCSSNTASGSILVDLEITPTFDPVGAICSGTSLTPLPTTSNNGITGAWSPAVDNTQTTTYTFTPDPNQCGLTTTLEVEVLENSSSNTSLTICADELPYTWNGVVFNAAGSQTATLVNAVGCDSLATLDLSVNTLPNFNVVAQDPTSCNVQNGQITISGLNPNTTYDISFNGGATTTYTANINGEVIIPGLASGTYTDFVLEKDGCSTTNTTSVTINELQGPQLDGGPDQTACEGEQIVLSASNPDGAVINWNNGVTDGVLFTPAPGVTTYTVTANLNGCIETDQVTVTVSPAPTVNAGNDITICQGESIILSGSGANTYVWDNGAVNGQPFNPPLGTTTYTVVGEVNGCVGTDQVTITVEAAPAISFDVFSDIDCAYSEITLVNTSPGTSSSCFWDMGDGTVLTSCDSVTYAYSQTGCFDVSLTITTAGGCQSSATVNDAICLESGPIADFTTNPSIAYTSDPTFEFTNESSGAVSYEWDFGDLSGTSEDVNPTYTYPFGQDGFYDVTLVAYNSSGCADTAIRRIEIREELIFWVPNAFTPDQDQYNEIFQPVFTSGFDPYDYNLLIFNRWGEIMFESNNAAVGWDGTYGGEIVKDGVYVWKIEFKDRYTDERYERSGHVTLIK
jgi:gliding motility-associated-like protein